MTRAKGWLVALGAMVLLGCGAGNAAGDGAAAPGTTPAGTPVGGSAADDEPLPPLAPLPRGASVDDRVARARQISDRLRLRSDRVQRWLRDARRAGYGRQTDCLDDLLSQLHAAERDAVESNQIAQAAATSGDERTVHRESSRLLVLEERSRLLVHSARSCGRPSPEPELPSLAGGVAVP